MNSPHHTLIWIDHREAKLFHFDATEVDRTVVRSSHPDQHIHHKANSPDSGHVGVDKEFLKRVAHAIAATDSLLITGPANAKVELASFIRSTQPALGALIRGVEPLDHPTDNELLELGRHFFRPADHLQELLRK